MSIVVMVVGSRGDVQPFIPIGRRLAERHRVRIATQREFRPMVEQAGLEFYPLGGNPHEMMEYIVKTGGSIIPTRLDQFWEDVPKKRAMIAEILASTWRACTEAIPSSPAPGRSGPTSSSPTRRATVTFIAPRRCTSRST
jgi:Glycosyl transferases, related to UDP-glucuronosyltransferase